MSVSPIIPADYPDQAGLAEAWAKFADIVQQTSAKLLALDDAETFQIAAEDGVIIGIVTAADVKRKFANLSWALSTAGETNGGVGEVKSQFGDSSNLQTWGAATAAVQASGLIGYAAWHELGLHYLALHETSHITLLGLETWQDCWREFLETKSPLDQYPASDQWRYNEQVANQVAKIIGARLGFDEIPVPSFGFPHICKHLGQMPA